MVDTKAVCPPWPDSPDSIRIGVRARGEVVVMRLSEFLKYLIVLLLVMALFVVVAR